MVRAVAIVLSAMLASSCASSPSGGVPAAGIERAPNVVLVLCDDLGWADVGAYGARGWRTPHVDRLASEGTRFTDFYAAQPVCSASRAAFLTGCYPNRIGIVGALGPDSTAGLAESETTLAEMCRERGYATALFGKWHLGHARPSLPAQHGFERFHGIPYSSDMWPYHPETPGAYPDLPTIEGEAVVALNADQRGFTRQVTDRAIDFVREESARGRPFFVEIAYALPHVPLFVSADFEGRSGAGLYGDVVEELDASVGRLMDALDDLDLARDTLFLFTSDNGPWLSYGDHAGSAGPLREGKGTVFEGGVRVPFIARWPGRVPAGAVCREPAMAIDLLPTVAACVGAPQPELPIDGRDIRPLLFGVPEARSPHEALYFWYENSALHALRSGRWKLHFPHGYRSMQGRDPGRNGVPGKYDYSKRTGLELYDLEADPGESRDVSAVNPEVVERLCALADGMRVRLGDSARGVRGIECRPAGRIGPKPQEAATDERARTP